MLFVILYTFKKIMFAVTVDVVFLKNNNNKLINNKIQYLLFVYTLKKIMFADTVDVVYLKNNNNKLINNKIQSNLLLF